MSIIMTFEEWQRTIVPKNQYIVQASTTDGLDGITAPSIGMCFHVAKPEINNKSIEKDLDKSIEKDLDKSIEKDLDKSIEKDLDKSIEKDLDKSIEKDLVLCAINGGTDQRRRGSAPINRKHILETLSNNGIQNICIEPDKYFTVLPKYKFIISPEGNGIDCHRHYEALMAKSIPIVEDSALIRAKYGNAPILYTKDYSEITQEYLEQKYAEMTDPNVLWDFSRLFLSSWSPEEQTMIMYRGNFWCEKLSGYPWYDAATNKFQINTHPFIDANKMPHVYVMGFAKIPL